MKVARPYFSMAKRFPPPMGVGRGDEREDGWTKEIRK